MYTLQLFSIGYTREAHRHFISKAADENFFSKYVLHNAPINCARVFNPKAREFSVNISEIPNYEYATYLIAEHNGKFYYYYITDYNVINGITVVYKVEEDIYHTYFNNRGDFFNFSGRLLQSNTKSDNVLYPTGAPFTLNEEFPFFNNSLALVPVVYLYVKNVGTLVLRENHAYSNASSIVSILNEALSAENVEVYQDNIKLYTSQFTVFSGYGIPKELVKENTAPEITYQFKVNERTYTFYFVGGLSVTKSFEQPARTSNFFGTPFNKINIGNNNTTVNLKAEFISLNNEPTLLLSVNNANFLNVIDDFAVTINYSEFSQYLAQNKMSSALSAISAGIGITKGILTPNFAQIGSGLLSAGALISGNQQAQERNNTVINSNMGNLVTTYSMYNKYCVSIQTYFEKNQDKIDNYFTAFGGECSGKYQTFADIIAVDGDKSVYKASGFFYRFSYIEGGSGGNVGGGAFMNKIADMFTNGIRIYYIQE